MTYWAFISYSHTDADTAHRLHQALETYRVPRYLVGQVIKGRKVPPKLTPIFLDRAELAGAPDLSEQITQALEKSSSLIVLCSATAARSRWVNREIEVFQELGKQDKIFAVICEKNSEAAPEFPPALTQQRKPDGTVSTIEPLAADLRPGKDGFTNAKLKIIAGVLGVSFDTLRQREQVRQRRRLFAIGTVSLLTLLIVATTYVALADSGTRLFGSEQIRARLDEHELSVFRHSASLATIADKASQLRRSLIANQLTDLETKDGVLQFAPDGRVGGTWQLGQLMVAIARSPEATPADLARLKKWAEVPFEQGRASEANGVTYGWLWYQLKHPQAEASIWMVAGVSTLLARKDALTADERKRFLDHLSYAQRAASIYYQSGTGKWEHLPNQKPHGQYSLNATISGLEAMIATREAGQIWRDNDGNDQLSNMIGDTASFLINLYDREGEWRDTPGWHGSQSNREVTPIPSLTLLTYAVLLKAAAIYPERVQLPTTMLADIAMRVPSLPDEQGPFSTDEDHFEATFIDLNGNERLGTYTYHEPWFPYAVSLSSEWLRHLQQKNASRADLVNARRVLGRLILEQGEEVTTGRANFYSGVYLMRLADVRAE